MKVLVSWSGGKDSAVMLHTLKKDKNVEIAGLMTTFSGHQEVNLHHVSRRLIEKQAESLNLPLFPVEISENAPNAEYEAAHQELLRKANEKEGVMGIAFGDIFLNEIRQYREEMVNATGVKPLFPLWGKESKEIVSMFLKAGFKAICVAARDDLPGNKFAGKVMGRRFFKALPENIDPCGENGEYHSYVYHGPGFKFPIAVSPQNVVLKDYNPQVDLKMYLSELIEQKSE